MHTIVFGVTHDYRRYNIHPEVGWVGGGDTHRRGKRFLWTALSVLGAENLTLISNIPAREANMHVLNYRKSNVVRRWGSLYIVCFCHTGRRRVLVKDTRN